MIKDFIKDIVRYLPAQVVPGIVGCISIPIITRLFSPRDYGNYSLTIATIMVLTTFLDWLPMSIIRFYPAYQRDKKLDTFYANIINLTFVSILALTIIFLIFLLFMQTHVSAKLYLLMCVGVGVFVVTGVFNTFQYFLRCKRQINWYSGFVIWKSLIGFGLGLGLVVLFRLGIEGLLWGVILGVAIILPLLWRKAIGNIPLMCSKINSSLTKDMAKYSFPLVVGNLAAWILSLSDRYILEVFRGCQEVGIYSAAYSISERSIMLLITLFTLASGPIAMSIWEKEGKEKSGEFVTKVTRFYLILCIPTIVGLSVLAKPIISILTGEQYHEGYKIIPFVASGILFLGLQQKYQAGLLFYKRTSIITFGVLASGLLNLFLNFLFVPRYGYSAAAIATLISYAFLLLLMIILSQQFFVWKFPFTSLARVTCASAVMGIVVYYMGNSLTTSVPINLICGITIGVGMYFLILLLLDEFSEEEIQILRLSRQKVLKQGKENGLLSP